MMMWLIGATSVVAQPGEGQGPPPQMVRVDRALTQMLQARWQVVGRLREVRRSVVAAEQSGRIVQLDVEQGDVVEGSRTVLARIDDVWAKLALAAAQATLSQAKAGVAEAQANLTQAQRDLSYIEELQARGSAKPKEVDDARSTTAAARARLDRARADVLAAEAALDRANVDLQRLRVVAPFDGVVTQKMTEVGQWVAPGDAVVEIISRGKIDALIDVPEKIINHVEMDEPVDVHVSAIDIETEGRVAAINPLGASAARTFPVKIRLDDQHGKLKAGMSVTAMVPTGERKAILTVPRDAVLRSPTGDVVWAAMDGRAMKVAVRVLFGHEDRYAVEVSPNYSGPPFRDGTLVIIEGAERLAFPGQPLNIMNPPKEESALDGQSLSEHPGT